MSKLNLMKTSTFAEIARARSNQWICWENWSCEIFPGFYYTLHSPETFEQDAIECSREDQEYYKRQGKEYPYTVIDEEYFDNLPQGFWNQYCNDVAEIYTDWIFHDVSGVAPGIITKMEFDHIWSPREYNFQTDKLNIRMKVKWSALEEWIQAHLDDFRKYLKEHWSSCSGFYSFVPNTYSELKDSDKYRDVCLEYLIRHATLNGNREDHIDYEIMENVTIESILDELDRSKMAA